MFHLESHKKKNRSSLLNPKRRCSYWNFGFQTEIHSLKQVSQGPFPLTYSVQASGKAQPLWLMWWGALYGSGSPLQMALSSLALLVRNRHEESMGTAFRVRTRSKTFVLEKDLKKLDLNIKLQHVIHSASFVLYCRDINDSKRHKFSV